MINMTSSYLMNTRVSMYARAWISYMIRDRKKFNSDIKVSFIQI